ncbi:MAG: hypothetical protein H6923_03860 [Alphaproteobacteria bacterium]|nr:hypothetical protein [Alphaproteobacteria bacterium]
MSTSEREIRNLVARMAERLEVATPPAAPNEPPKFEAADPEAIARAVRQTVGLSGKGIGPDRWRRMSVLARLEEQAYETGVAKATLAAMARKYGAGEPKGAAKRAREPAKPPRAVAMGPEPQGEREDAKAQTRRRRGLGLFGRRG